MKEFDLGSSDIVVKSVEAVRQCLTKRDYLSIYQLDAGGGSAVNIDVTILHALMKGTKAVCVLLNVF